MPHYARTAIEIGPHGKRGNEATGNLRRDLRPRSRGGPSGPPPCVFYFWVTRMATRRFFARPSAVLLSATGCWSPYPSASTRLGSTPSFCSSLRTDSARACESCLLASGLPELSVYPPIFTRAAG